MTIRGHVRNGVIVPDSPEGLPEGAEVQIRVLETGEKPRDRRPGGVWNGKVKIADDFDVLPDDLANAFGISDS